MSTTYIFSKLMHYLVSMIYVTFYLWHCLLCCAKYFIKENIPFSSSTFMLENNQPLFLTEQEFLICHNLILLRTYKNKKSLDLTVKATLSISTLHQAVVSVLRPQLTAQRIVSSAISFRLPSDSISADASPDSPLPFGFLWAIHSTAYRCFLSTF